MKAQLTATQSNCCDEPLLSIISAPNEAMEATVENPDSDHKINRIKETAKNSRIWRHEISFDYYTQFYYQIESKQLL